MVAVVVGVVVVVVLVVLEVGVVFSSRALSGSSACLPAILRVPRQEPHVLDPVRDVLCQDGVGHGVLDVAAPVSRRLRTRGWQPKRSRPGCGDVNPAGGRTGTRTGRSRCRRWWCRRRCWLVSMLVSFLMLVLVSMLISGPVSAQVSKQVSTRMPAPADIQRAY